jgi:hypothetical protein
LPHSFQIYLDSPCQFRTSLIQSQQLYRRQPSQELLHPVFTFEFVEAFDDLEDGNDGNSVVTEGAVIAGGSSDNVLINPF